MKLKPIASLKITKPINKFVFLNKSNFLGMFIN